MSFVLLLTLIIFINSCPSSGMSKKVIMNLNDYSPIVAKELFPNAQIVIDRFHMVQMLTRSFNIFRV